MPGEDDTKRAPEGSDKAPSGDKPKADKPPASAKKKKGAAVKGAHVVAAGKAVNTPRGQRRAGKAITVRDFGPGAEAAEVFAKLKKLGTIITKADAEKAAAKASEKDKG